MNGLTACSHYSGRINTPSREVGVALAIVLWFVAGMSLLIAGIVADARIDTKMAQLHFAKAKATTVGDGAIRLSLALYNEASANEFENFSSDNEYRIGDTMVVVRMVPALGLINLNSAPQWLLAALFAQVAHIEAENADKLASNVTEWRSGGAGRRVGYDRRFRSAEDILRVPGISRKIFDAVRDYIVAGEAGAQIDWSQVPEDLVPLAKFSGFRDTVRPENTSTRRGAARNYRVDALVQIGGATWLRRRWINFVARRDSPLPWRVERTEPARVTTTRTGDK